MQLEYDVPMVHHLDNSFDVLDMLEEIEVLDYLRVAHHHLFTSLRGTEAVRRTSESMQTAPP